MKWLVYQFLTQLFPFLIPGAFDQLKQNATKARIPFYGRQEQNFNVDSSVKSYQMGTRNAPLYQTPQSDLGGLLASWLDVCLWIKLSRFKAWMGTMCCVLWQDTFLPNFLLPLQFYKWTPANLVLRGNPVIDQHPILEGVERFLVAFCYRTWDTLRPDGPLGSYLPICRLIYTGMSQKQIVFGPERSVFLH